MNNIITMSKTAILTVRIDPEVKSKVERLYASFGLNLADAVNMFIHQSLIVGGLPFELKNPGFKRDFSIDDDTFREKPVELTVEDLKKMVAPVAEKYDLKSLYLVGSRARGDNRPDSDYDFCYVLKRPSLTKAAGLMDFLCKSTNSEVDLIDRNMCSEKLLKEIEKNGILIYEG